MIVVEGIGPRVVFQDLSKENRRRHEKARKAYAFSLQSSYDEVWSTVIKQQNRQNTLFCCFDASRGKSGIIAWRKSSSWILLDDESRASPHVWKLIFIPELNFFRLILLFIIVRHLTKSLRRSSNIMLMLQNNNKQIRGTSYGKEVRSYLFYYYNYWNNVILEDKIDKIW